MTSIERNKTILLKYIPEQAVDLISHWIYHFDFKLKIKKERSSKQGDYRAPLKNIPAKLKNARPTALTESTLANYSQYTNHQITINRNLNKYAFLITLIHEIAHLTNWNKFKHKVKPHGEEWKHEFKILMKEFSCKDIFPEDVLQALNSYLKDPAASSCSDIQLSRVLKKYDQKEGVFLLEQIPAKTIFKFNGNRDFIKGEKLRKRYKCMELKTRRQYLFSPIAEVELVESNVSLT